jgi:hypothetical protein
MNIYQITFYGRLKGAIGASYRIVATRQGVDLDAAILALYDQYEHVMVSCFEIIN